MMLRIVLLVWFAGFVTGLAAQYAYDRWNESEDWLDCIAEAECAIDQATPMTKPLVRTRG